MDPISQRVSIRPGLNATAIRTEAPVPASGAAPAAAPQLSYKVSLSADAASARAAQDPVPSAPADEGEDGLQSTADALADRARTRELERERAAAERAAEARERARERDRVRSTLNDDGSAIVLTRTDAQTEVVTELAQIALVGVRAEDGREEARPPLAAAYSASAAKSGRGIDTLV